MVIPELVPSTVRQAVERITSGMSADDREHIRTRSSWAALWGWPGHPQWLVAAEH